MTETPLAYLSAAQLTALYRARKISPVEVVTDALARIEASGEIGRAHV